MGGIIMDETEYLLNSPKNTERLNDSIKELHGVWKDFPSIENIRHVKGEAMQLDVIEKDGEKFVILPDSVLEKCGVGDIIDMSVENGCIVLKPVDSN